MSDSRTKPDSRLLRIPSVTNLHFRWTQLLAKLSVIATVAILVCAPARVVAQDQQRLAEAERLNSQVVRFYGEQKFAQAIPIATRVLQIWEAELGPKSADVALGLTNLAELHRSLGNNAAAKPLHLRALKIREQIHGEDHLETALSATYVGILLEAETDFAGAERQYRRALKIREKAVGPNHFEVANALYNLANLLRTQGKLAEAEPLLKRGLEIRRETMEADHPDNAPSLNALASLYQVQGRYTEAEPLYDRCLRIREKHLGTDHPLTASTINNLGGLYELQGNYEKAERFYRRALQIFEQKNGANHYDTGIALNNLAGLYKSQERFKDSLPIYQRALRILESSVGSEHHFTAEVYNNLASVQESLGDFASAEAGYKKAIAVKTKVLGAEHPSTARSINNLGLLMASSGRIPDAIQMLKQGLEIRRQTLGAESPDTLSSLDNLAAWQQQQGSDESIATLDQCRQGARGYILNVLPGLSEFEQSLFLKAKYERGLHLALSCAVLHTDSADAVQKSAVWLLNGKAIGQEALAMQSLANRTGVPAPKPEAWIELSRLREALPPKSVCVDIARFEQFDFKITPGAATWKSAHYAAWITPPAGQGDVQLVDLGPADLIDEQIKNIRVLILNAFGEKGLIADAGEQKAVEILNTSLETLSARLWNPIAKHVQGAEQLILSPDGNLWLFPWSALPVSLDKNGDPEFLIEKFSLRLIVSGRDLTRPKLAISTSPPVILANPKFDQQEREKKLSIQYVLKNLPLQNEEAVRSIAVKTPLKNVPPLPNTGIEALAIESQLKSFTGREPQIYQGQYALESIVRKIERPQVLLFATHGFFLPQQEAKFDPFNVSGSGDTRSLSVDRSGRQIENPLLRCGLLLSGCSGSSGDALGADDGILTGLEVTGIDLRGTELVVLSACETGVGEVRQGEGVSGLRQAFQLAGAEAVVASLWQVSDRETSMLMIDFFRNLAEGQSRAEALRAAQIARIENRRNLFGAAHPYYWAAFTLTGR